MKSSGLKISISVESHDEKTEENYRNCYVAENIIVKDIDPMTIDLPIDKSNSGLDLTTF